MVERYIQVPLEIVHKNVRGLLRNTRNSTIQELSSHVYNKLDTKNTKRNGGRFLVALLL
jgi:hypothetical protein